MKEGYYRKSETEKSQLPWPTELRINRWEQLRMSFMRRLLKLESCAKRKVYKGVSHCRLCNARVGNSEFTYKTYDWPNGLHHYIADHHVCVTEAFYRFVLQHTKEIPLTESEQHFLDEGNIMEKFLGSFDKSETGRIDVAFKEFSGKNFFDVRKMYKDKAGEFQPTKKGIAVPVNKLPALLKAVQAAVDIAKAEGLLDEEGDAKPKAKKAKSAPEGNSKTVKAKAAKPAPAATTKKKSKGGITRRSFK